MRSHADENLRHSKRYDPRMIAFILVAIFWVCFNIWQFLSHSYVDYAGEKVEGRIQFKRISQETDWSGGTPHLLTMSFPAEGSPQDISIDKHVWKKLNEGDKLN